MSPCAATIRGEVQRLMLATCRVSTDGVHLCVQHTEMAMFIVSTCLVKSWNVAVWYVEGVRPWRRVRVQGRGMQRG